MLTQEVKTCADCRGQVTLYTDGRLAYATTDPMAGDETYHPGDSTQVWREGISLVTACPRTYVRGGGRCGGRVVFPGEGRIIEEPFWWLLMANADIVEPILRGVPA